MEPQHPMRSIDDAPIEISAPIMEFWPIAEWDHAASISLLESGWRWDAENDTTRAGTVPCGTVIDVRDGVNITAEHSIGYFQINACNYPDWNPGHFFNARQNAGTAHALWQERGWSPWFFSAQKLGLV